MTTPHVAPQARDDDRFAELGGLLLLWAVPFVGFLLAVLGLGY